MLYQSFDSLIDAARGQNMRLSEVVWREQAESLSMTPEACFAKMRDQLTVMRQSVANGMKEGLRSIGGLTGGNAWLVQRAAEENGGLAGPFMSDVMAFALATAEWNACMGRIVAAPTAGSCGIVPACLLALEKHRGVSEEDLVRGLFHAAGVGMVIARNASLSGAEGGCQAECGSAAAMAASAMVEILGGDAQVSAHAAANALKSVMGLVCDPVAGLVEEPCVIRNASCAVIAVSAAQMALAGVPSVIPADEVIAAMKQVGDALPPALRETAQGGIAKTQTGKRLGKGLLGEEA